MCSVNIISQIFIEQSFGYKEIVPASEDMITDTTSPPAEKAFPLAY